MGADTCAEGDRRDDALSVLLQLVAVVGGRGDCFGGDGGMVGCGGAVLFDDRGEVAK